MRLYIRNVKVHRRLDKINTPFDFIYSNVSYRIGYYKVSPQLAMFLVIMFNFHISFDKVSIYERYP